MLRMEKRQELEWAEAQRIEIREDLVPAAKLQLRFLAEVERNGCLYDGPALDRAISRYKYCWLPLLARHNESGVAKDGPLVVPLDCEWVWHCHRLNPVRYKSDCNEFHGELLGTKNVVSSVSGFCSKQTEEIWGEFYPHEPYELNMKIPFTVHVKDAGSGAASSTSYDLVTAVTRQSSFFYQVSKPYMNEDIFLKEAVSRYKGFLHLIKRNIERSICRFCVPTYDIDLIWHAHQLHPTSYCGDLMTIMGKVLEHDDTDSDRSKGMKLDVGFSVTTKQWEETFGSRYWRAGAMYKGKAPSPLKTNLKQLDLDSKKAATPDEDESMTNPPKGMRIEVMVEIMEARNIPAGQKGQLLVVFRRKQPDLLFISKSRLSIFSETAEKDVAIFQCDPKGELHFDLISYSSSPLAVAEPGELLGTTSISLQDLINKPISQLDREKWLLLKSGDFDNRSISLRISLSFTPPFPAPTGLYMLNTTVDGSRETEGAYQFIGADCSECKGWIGGILATEKVTAKKGTKVIPGKISHSDQEGDNQRENRNTITSSHFGGFGGCGGRCGGRHFGDMKTSHSGGCGGGCGVGHCGGGSCSSCGGGGGCGGGCNA